MRGLFGLFELLLLLGALLGLAAARLSGPQAPLGESVGAP